MAMGPSRTGTCWNCGRAYDRSGRACGATRPSVSSSRRALGVALEALGFEVAKEEFSWWRSLPASTDLGAERRDLHPMFRLVRTPTTWSSPTISSRCAHGQRPENPLAPLLILADLAHYALPRSPQNIDARIPASQRAVDSIVDRKLDWGRIEHGFAQFVDAVERAAPVVEWAPPHKHAHPADAGLPGWPDEPSGIRRRNIRGGMGRQLPGDQHGCSVWGDRSARTVARTG